MVRRFFNDERGFTLAETAGAVAIIVVLLALIVPNILTWQKDLRQKELDAKAEIVFVAVQNKMMSMRTTGNADVYQVEGDNEGKRQSDARAKKIVKLPEFPNGYTEDADLYAMSSADWGDGPTAEKVVKQGTIDGTLAGNNWVVEYNPQSGSVYAVYYSESDGPDFSDYTDLAGFDEYDMLRNRAYRIEQGSHVGYYGGDVVTSSTSSRLQPSITVSNKEKLSVTLRCSLPIGVDDSNTLQFKVILSDDHGNQRKIEFNRVGENGLKRIGRSYSATLVLDDLSSDAKRFNKLYGKLSGPIDSDTQLVPGDALNIRFTVSSVNHLIQPRAITAKTNSLFADATNEAAYKNAGGHNTRAVIEYGRHLQNLDVLNSDNVNDVPNRVTIGSVTNPDAYLASNENPNPEITAAEITKSIDFGETLTTDDWYHTYSVEGKSFFNGKLDGSITEDYSARFKPITAPYINIVEGNNNRQNDPVTISNLNVSEEDGSAGLFASIGSDATLRNISLVNATVKVGNPPADSATGGLVGTVTADNTATVTSSEGGGAQAGGGEGAGAAGTGAGANANANANANTIAGTGAGAGTNANESANAGTGSSPGETSLGPQSIEESADADQATIEHCRVYLANENNVLANKDDYGIWVNGATTGGLVGLQESGSKLTIKDSFAATVQSGTAASGGLVGEVQSANGASTTLDIETSYADSYVHGETNAAGLLGSVADGADVQLENCYAAGFLYGGAGVTLAGLSGGPIDRAFDVYTAASPGGFTMTYSTAPSIGYIGVRDDVPTVYYLHGGNAAENPNATGTNAMGSMGSGELYTAMGGGKGNNAYTDVRSNASHPYNLKGQSLISYVYPMLAANDHYGDWEAEFDSGALVYYEKYNSNEVGFYGANVDSTITEDNVIVGDGYGIVYRTTDRFPEEMKVFIDDPEPVGSASPEYPERSVDTEGGFDLKELPRFTVYAKNGDQFYVYPLPTEMLNSPITLDDAAFYRHVTIAEKRDGVPKTSDYFFNPYFAKTVQIAQGSDAARPELRSDDQIAIRSPRHLHNLSLYYDKYSTSTEGRTFTQERDISYSLYDWNGFFWYSTGDGKTNGSGTVWNQEPIGRKGSHFKANYNGNCYWITDMSVIARGSADTGANGIDEEDNIGMFGYNEGRLTNIVIRCDYNEADAIHYYVQREDPIVTNEVVCMGVLAGANGPTGVISNCAVAGYYVAGREGTIQVYSNGMLYCGGLVGSNEGTIRYSAADSPTLRMSTLEADVYLGGFVGHNKGTGVVTDCYDIGYLEVATARGGYVAVAGFAGSNQGTVKASYCATALTVSGEAAVTFGFAPVGGVVSTSNYLNNGTYTYVNHLRSYNCNHETTSATYATRDGLCNLRARNHADKDHIFDYSNTKTDKADGFPYRAVVKGHDGKWTHYGDWQGIANLGTLGVFYWEHEQHGSNDGYHLTYIGVASGETTDANGQVTERFDNFGDTTLCTAHDDGGLITEYGYGYFTAKVETASVATLDGSDTSNEESQDTMNVTLLDNGKTTSGLKWSEDSKNNVIVNKDAKADLEAQVPSYDFYPITTRTESDINPNDGNDDGDFLYLSDKTSANREGKWVLQYGDDTFSFVISPFFANAMSYAGADPITGSDGESTDYSKVPGGTDHQYDVRSLQQLQYLNWNHKELDTTELVDANNKQEFPYLQYRSNALGNTESNVQTFADAEKVRPQQLWRQTHDLGVAKDESYNFTPIAGTTEHSPDDNTTTTILQAWFGGQYDGKSYKIQNFDLKSSSYAVGLFGITAGATIKNIILYSDKDKKSAEEALVPDVNTGDIDPGGNVIQRVTPTVTAKNDERGAYALGGLIGVAYDYKENLGSGKNTIENCAIAGYSIVDNSTNRQTRGGANIGGLIGISNVELKKCESVVDIYINARPYTNPNLGGYVRVGGITGAAQYNITDCYAGGSIIASKAALEQYWTARDKKVSGIAYEDAVALYEAKKAERASSSESESGEDSSSESDATNTNADGSANDGGDNFGNDEVNGSNGDANESASDGSVDENANAGNSSSGEGDSNAPESDEEGASNEVTAWSYDSYVAQGDDFVPVESDGRPMLNRYNNLHIFVAGIAGSAYGSNYKNFTGRQGESDATPAITRCISYVDLPAIEGTVRAVSYIAGPADRSGASKCSITMTDCHYLDVTAEKFEGSYNAPPYVFEMGKNNESKALDPYYLMNEKDYENLLMGKFEPIFATLHKDGGYAQVGVAPTVVAYDRLANRSLTPRQVFYVKEEDKVAWSAWDRVTVKEGNTPIPGKYSFPGNRSDLKGKNYPFPTVITQPDLIYKDGTTVNVHYGEWPSQGVMWAQGIASMDVFSDMVLSHVSESTMLRLDSVGWAEKEFVLNDPNKVLLKARTDESGNTRAIAVSDFNVNETTIARVVGVEQVSDTRYKIRVRALREGAVTIKETLSPNEADFVLLITAKLSITTEPSRVIDYQLDSEGNTNESTFVASAHSSGAPYNDFTESLNGNWSIEKTESDIISPVEDSNHAWKVSHSDPCSIVVGISYTYTYPSQGLADAYHAIDSTYTAYTHEYNERLNVPIKTFGAIGMSVDPQLVNDADVFNEALRKKAPADVTGIEALHSDNKPTLPSSVDGDFFLYESLTDKDLDGHALGGVTVKRISIAYSVDGEVQEPVVLDIPLLDETNDYSVDSNGFRLTIDSKSSLVRDSYYEYLPCHLRWLDKEREVSDVTVTVDLVHDEDVAEVTDDEAGSTVAEYTNYHFSVNMSVPRYVYLFFDLDGGRGTVKPMKVTDPSTTKMPGGITKVGYRHVGWICTSPETYKGTEVEVGKPCGIYEDASFKAKWEPIQYKVRFNENVSSVSDAHVVDHYTYEGEESEEKPVNNPVTLKYDEETTLPTCKFVRTDKPEDATLPAGAEYYYRFAGWASRSYGDPAYPDGGTVKNLTAVDNSTITLYACWEQPRTIKLDPCANDAPSPKEGDTSVVTPSDVKSYTVYNKLTNSLPNYSEYKPSIWHHTLIGWYTEAGDGKGVRILDADGNIASAVAGYTYDSNYADPGDESGKTTRFNLGDKEEVTLYAHWSTDMVINLFGAGQKYQCKLSEVSSISKVVSASSNKPKMVKTGFGTNHDKTKTYDCAFDGWFANASESNPGGTKVFNADGSVVDMTPIYDACGNLELQARWKESFVYKPPKEEGKEYTDAWKTDVYVNFEAGDVLHVSFDASPDGPPKYKDNVLSFGTGNLDTHHSNGNTDVDKFHFYYTPEPTASDGTNKYYHMLNIHSDGWGTNTDIMRYIDADADNRPVHMVFTKEDLEVNGVGLSNWVKRSGYNPANPAKDSDYKVKRYQNKLTSIIAAAKKSNEENLFYLASQEGKNRSAVTEYTVWVEYGSGHTRASDFVFG